MSQILLEFYDNFLSNHRLAKDYQTIKAKEQEELVELRVILFEFDLFSKTFLMIGFD